MEYAIQAVGDYDELLEVTRFSEERGLPAFAVPDHYLYATDPQGAADAPAPDVFVQLSALARETTALRLVVLVSPITFRHPAVLLKMGIEIDRLSGGRFTLGVGTGWMVEEHEVFGFPFPPLTERFAMLEEALGYLRAGLADEPVGFSGERYRLEAWPIVPRPIDLRLLVGGVGPRRTPDLAGRYADEFNAFYGPGLDERIARARRAAAEAGRDPERLFVSTVTWVVGAETSSGIDAQIDRIAQRRHVERAQLDEQLRRRNALVGTYDELRREMARLAELGVGRFYLQGGFDPDATPRLLDALAV